MWKRSSLLALSLVCAIGTSCAIKHPVAADYGKYLANNAGTKTFEETGLSVAYGLTEAAAEHHLEFRSMTAGYANVWIVDFGSMLEDTLSSNDVQAAFVELRAIDGSEGSSLALVTFDLEHYSFESYGAHITLKAKVTSDGTTVLDESYTADGKSQGGKVFWTGAFGMKNAIQQSTKLAVDQILEQFLSDLRQALGGVSP